METFDFGIGIYIPDKEVIEYKIFYQDGNLITPQEIPLSNKNCFSVYCLEKQKTIFINDLENEYKSYISKLPEIWISRSPNSLIYIPLTVKEKKIGLLAINSIKKNAFSRNDILKLQALAAYIAIAFDNSRAHAVLLKKNKLLSEKQKKIEEQSEQLYETNTLLEERQQHIEEQSEKITATAEELSVTNEELKKSNATKDRLFSIIAHDIKNPFNSILGFSQLIVDFWDKKDHEKLKPMVENINSSTRTIYDLLENLLQWSRSQMGSIKFNPEKIILKDLVKENIRLLSNLITQKNISIKLDIPDDLYCYADSQMIRAVIRNILTNAVKFTENGTITISSEVNSDIVKVSIIDSGVGIAKAKLKDLFEVKKSKISRGTRGEQGTGLGLIICKEFITQNNGEIYAKSVINKGTTFVFTLPLNKSSKILK
jgi:signal transduction histidine kinase